MALKSLLHVLIPILATHVTSRRHSRRRIRETQTRNVLDRHDVPLLVHHRSTSRTRAAMEPNPFGPARLVKAPGR
jgi:hypothetical protein